MQLVKEFKEYEKDNFQKFTTYGTKTVNSVLKRNILKLEFCDTMLELQKERKMSKTKKDKLSARRPSALMTGKDRSRYTNIATAVRWLVNRPDALDPQLALAQKLVRAARSTPSQMSSSGSQTPASEFKINQAQLMVSAVSQKKIPTWREVIGESVLIEYKLKFALNFSYGKVSSVSPLFAFRSCMLMKSLSSLVSQIGYISNDIKLRIERLESFAMFELDGDKVKEARVTASEVVLKAPTQQKEHHYSHHHSSHRQQHHQQQQSHQDSRHESVTPTEGAVMVPAITRADDAGSDLEKRQKRPKKVSIKETDDSVKPCRDYFDALEKDRNAKTIKLLQLYDSIGPILIKLESLVLGTFTGECPEMKYYYNHWEKQVFGCFTRFAAKNLEKFMNHLLHNQPLFEVDAILTVPEILMRPSSTDAYSIMINSVKDFLLRLKNFKRWTAETCLPCPVSKCEEKEFYFTFFEDVVQLAKVSQPMDV
uniref:Uncharacterized protein n=1 Tax=Anopheles christyi TaxID=43041 RepID=A0A182K9N2_9DIPT